MKINNLWRLASKDLSIMSKSRASILLTFLVPMVVTLIFGAVFGGFGSSESGIAGIRTGIVVQDTSSVTRKIVTELDSLDEIRLVRDFSSGEVDSVMTEKRLRGFITEGKLPVGLIIAHGFGDSLLNGERPTLRMLYDAKFRIERGIVSGMLQKTIMTRMPGLFQERMWKLAQDELGTEKGVSFRTEMESVVKEYFPEADFSMDTMGGMPAEGDSSGFAMDAMFELSSEDLTGAERENPAFAMYVAGMAVMFLLFSVSEAGASLISERKEGTIRRLLIAPVSAGEIIGGKMLFVTLVGVVQLFAMFVFGWLVFGLDMWAHIPGLLVMIVATSLACGSLGMLLATVCRTQQQVGGLSTLLILAMSALGGSMFPRFMMPDYMQTIGMFTINRWAMDGLTGLFWYQRGVVDILPQAGILMGITIVFYGIAHTLFLRRLFDS